MPPTTNLPPAIRAVVRCPACGEGVVDSEEIRCVRGHVIPLVDGVFHASLDALDDLGRRTVEGFGYEWDAFPEIKPEDELFWERYARDLDLDALRGRLAIDVGCGKGRFSWFLAPHVEHLVAFDASRSAMVAARNLAARTNVTVFRADLHRPPFAEGAFGFVCCIGVLHYVPDPAAGFQAVERLLAPGGVLLLSVYSRSVERGVRRSGLAAAAALRRLTPRIPKPVLRILSAPLALLLAACFVWPGMLGDRFGIGVLRSLPLQTYRRRPLRSLWLDTLNRLAAPLEHRFTWSEVERWLTDAGLEVEHVREDAGWMVVARRSQSAIRS